MLPFPMAALSVDNPALVPWRRAASERSRDLSATLKVYHHLTPRAKGVVYLFHGGEGSAEQWVAGEEEAALVADLVRCRYSVVALESTHRPIENNWFFPDPERFDPAVFEAALTPGWNATVNADELLLRAVHAQLGFNSGTRVYLAGFSSGAKFACAMAYNLRFDPPAMADYCYATPRAKTAGGLNVCAAAFYNNAVVPYYLGNYVASPKDPASAQKARQYSTPSIFNYSELDAKIRCPRSKRTRALSKLSRWRCRSRCTWPIQSGSSPTASRACSASRSQNPAACTRRSAPSPRPSIRRGTCSMVSRIPQPSWPSTARESKACGNNSRSSALCITCRRRTTTTRSRSSTAIPGRCARARGRRPLRHRGRAPFGSDWGKAPRSAALSLHSRLAGAAKMH